MHCFQVVSTGIVLLSKDLVMSLKRYVIWNNKGGTGKTTLAFHLSTEYAIQNSEKYIIVIDMCPQMNISAALLSNLNENMKGTPGDKMVREIATGEKVQNVFDKTICGYLLSRLDTTLRGDIPCTSFLVQPHHTNKYITKNVYLLCGDQYMEAMNQRLEQERQLIPTKNDKNPWKRVTLFIKDFIDKLSTEMDRECIVFIDTNPSFSINTEMAVAGATRVIVPINADDFSGTAVNSMLYLIYGIAQNNEEDDVLKQKRFYYLAPRSDITIPKIYLIINNKITPYNTRSASAFSAKAKEVLDSLSANFLANPHIYVPGTREEYECELNDFHTKAIQCLQIGCPLSKLPASIMMHGDEKVHNVGKTKDDYLVNLQVIISRL